MRKTKIVITVGPALMRDGRLREALALVDAVRINASHGDLDSRLALLDEVRRQSGELERRIPVLLDLQGPKWRVGAMAAPVELPQGSQGGFVPPGAALPAGLDWAVPLPHPELFQGALPGQTWVLDDGDLEVEVTGAGPELVAARVTAGGVLKPHKGVHPIGLELPEAALTAKDFADIRWGVEQGVDLFAQSFVRRADDILALQRQIRGLGGDQPVIGKIEHPQALEHLEEILAVSWGIMIDRGDLGVALGPERVPALQKQIIAKARQALKPVITATQMLDSMIERPRPTRAEASDVANAIWDGTDAVMLSAESAAGSYPLEAIRWLVRIAEDADNHLGARLAGWEESQAALARRTGVSVAFAACRTAAEIGARFIIVFTEGGGSARMVSRLTGSVPVIGATTDPVNARRIGLLRGVEALLVPRLDNADAMVALVEGALRKRHGLAAGDTLVITLGLPLWKADSTNTMKVIKY